jgi:hypothetical protein
MAIHVILRTCSNSSAQIKLTGTQRIVPCSLPELRVKCFASLLRTVKYFKLKNNDIRLTILDDHSSSDFLDKLNFLIDKYALADCAKITSLEGTGSQNSAYQQFLYGRQSEADLVYLVEDDYFHTEDAISAMFSFQTSGQVQSINPFKRVAVSPYDCPHRYWPQQHRPSVIFYHENRYWRTINNSSYTVFLDASVIRDAWSIFEAMSTGICEDNTINRLWSNLVLDSGVVALVSPIPSVAVHVSYLNEPPNKLITNMTDFEHEWTKFEV